MTSLGEEIKKEIKQRLEAEITFYASRGFITKDEQSLIFKTFDEATTVASKTLPLDLVERPIVFSQETQETSLTEKIEKVVEDAMVKLGVKAAYDDSPWNGNASQWKTPEAYCASCLIDMNEGSGPKTKDRCKLPYKKPGSSSINKNALRAMASGGRGLPALKGVPKDQVVKAANFMIRHWQAAFDKPAPANIYRMAGKNPPNGGKESSVKFFKDKEGQWWMLGMYSNRWMDREHEIISEAAHKEYAEWVNKTGFKPQVTVYHLPKMPEGFWEKLWEKWGEDVNKLNDVVKKVYSKIALGEVQRIVYLNGFSVAAAKIYPDKYDIVEKLAETPDIGMSHGFLAFDESDPADFSSMKDTVNIIEKYRSFEVSVLLRKRAANYGTAPIFVEGKQVTYSEEDRAFMAKAVPPELLEVLDSGTKEAAETMDELLEYKELTEPEVEEEKKEVLPEPVEEVKAVPPKTDEDTEDEDMEEEEKKKKPEDMTECKTDVKETGVEEKVVEAVMKALNIEQLQTVLATLVENQQKLLNDVEALKSAKKEVEEDVKSLKQSEDEKIAAKLSPVNWAQVGFSPSKADATVVSKEQAEQQTKNGPGTVASITGDEVADRFLKQLLEGNK